MSRILSRIPVSGAGGTLLPSVLPLLPIGENLRYADGYLRDENDNQKVSRSKVLGPPRDGLGSQPSGSNTRAIHCFPPTLDTRIPGAAVRVLVQLLKC